jgi:hypothetical protein
MKQSTLKTCLSILAGMLSPSQPWDDNAAAIYTLALKDWPDDVAVAACKHAALNEKWRPAPVDLRGIAVRLIAPEPPITELVAQARRIVAYYPPGRERKAAAGRLIAEGKAHLLTTLIVENLGGWDAIGRYGEGELDTAFVRSYPAAVKDWQETTSVGSGNLPRLTGRQSEPVTIAPNIAGFIQARQGELMRAGDVALRTSNDNTAGGENDEWAP